MNNKNWIHVVIVLLILAIVGGGYYYWKNNQKDGNNEKNIKEQTQKEIDKIKSTIDKISPPEISDGQDIESQDTTISMKDYYNEDRNIKLQYPADWMVYDIGGEKNVSQSLTRENIAFFYLPNSEVDTNDPSSSIVSVKLIRFILEESVEIRSADDWYNYIKTKVDDFIANPMLSADYKLNNLARGENIDGQWVIIEDYIESDLIIGKDYYIHKNGELYQFIAKAPNVYFTNYFSLIERIVKSIEFD